MMTDRGPDDYRDLRELIPPRHLPVSNENLMLFWTRLPTIVDIADSCTNGSFIYRRNHTYFVYVRARLHHENTKKPLLVEAKGWKWTPHRNAEKELEGAHARPARVEWTFQSLKWECFCLPCIVCYLRAVVFETVLFVSVSVCFIPRVVFFRG